MSAVSASECESSAGAGAGACRTCWRARVTPAAHPVSGFDFNVLIGADGKRYSVKGAPFCFLTF